MRKPSNDSLPFYSPCRNKWPWVPNTTHHTHRQGQYSHYPKISLVTPSLNQGQYLEETILSVLNQEYPNLEYIVVDGKSSDDSLQIIKKYSHFLSQWVSESDLGQADAINKGFNICSGDILGWINSDDMLLPGALFEVAQSYSQNPSSLQVGDCIIFSNDRSIFFLRPAHGVSQTNMMALWDLRMSWAQPSTFIPRAALEQCGNLDRTLRFAFDREWMCRLLEKYPITYIHRPLSMFRLHDQSKTVRHINLWLDEHALICEKYASQLPIPPKKWRARLEVTWGALPNLSILRGTINQRGAWRHLLLATRSDLSILLFPLFWVLVVFASLPLPLLRFILKTRVRMLGIHLTKTRLSIDP